MTIRDLVRAYVLADPTVASLVGTRVHPDVLPEKAVYPAVTVQQIDIVRPGVLKGKASRAIARLQFDVYANPTTGGSRAKADDIARALRGRLEGAIESFVDSTTSPSTTVRAEILIDPSERAGAQDEVDGGLSDYSMDFKVFYTTQGGLY